LYFDVRQPDCGQRFFQRLAFNARRIEPGCASASTAKRHFHSLLRSWPKNPRAAWPSTWNPNRPKTKGMFPIFRRCFAVFPLAWQRVPLNVQASLKFWPRRLPRNCGCDEQSHAMHELRLRELFRDVIIAITLSGVESGTLNLGGDRLTEMIHILLDPSDCYRRCVCRTRWLWLVGFPSARFCPAVEVGVSPCRSCAARKHRQN